MNILALSSLLLVADGLFYGIVIPLAVLLVGGAVASYFIGSFMRKKNIDKRLGEVEQRTSKMIEDASLECKALKKEALLEAKEQVLQQRKRNQKDAGKGKPPAPVDG